jgi:hypothetical protein
VSSAYAGERIALLTQHGKERVLAPVLEPELGCTIVHVDGFDTDRLGTFTREISRPGTQRDAALRKARLGMELSGLRLGLASEGSFGPDPFVGMLPWNVEMLVLVDDRLGIEVTATAQAPGRSAHLRSDDWAELEAFARREGFPEHALVMRPHDQDDLRVHKGIATWPALGTAFAECAAASPEGLVFVEHDLRAFANPTRMANIGNAARELLQRIASRCPACGAPGYWVTHRTPGLPCRDCGAPTRLPAGETLGCLKCRHTECRPTGDPKGADPEHCDHCNP